MADNTVSFRLTVSGAEESEAQVLRVRTALSGVALSLDSNRAATLSSDAAEQQHVQTLDKLGVSYVTWWESVKLVSDNSGGAYDAQMRLVQAARAARDAVQAAVVPTGSWAKGISDAAAAAAQGGPAYGTLARAFGQTGSASRQLGNELQVAHKELFEGARLTRSFVDALLLAAPGVGNLTGMFTRLSRETSGFTVAQVGATAGALALVALLGSWVAALKEVLDTQVAANVAVKGLDFSGMDTALTKSIGAWETYQQKIAIAADATENFNFRSVAGLEVAVGKISGKTSALVATLLLNAAAWDKTWQSMGRAVDTGKAEVAQIDATTAALRVQRETVTSPAALEATFTKEADLARQRARIAAEDIATTRTVVAERLADAAAIAQAEGQTLLAARLSADVDQYRANTAKLTSAEIQKGESAATGALLAGAKARAAVVAGEIQDAGRLIEIKGRIATESIRSSQAEVDARMAVAKADADFFGTSLQGLTQYQAARRAAIVQEGQVEIGILAAVHQQERQAQLTKAGGLQGTEQQAAYRQLAIMAQEYEAKRQALADQTAQKLRDNALKETEDRRANFARDIALVAATYAQEEALGQGDLTVKLGFLRQAAQDENLSLQQRRQYAVQFYTDAKAAEAALAAYHQSIGATTVTQDLARLRTLADAYAQNTVERIKAEQDYADGVRQIEDQRVARAKAFGPFSVADEVQALAERAAKYGEFSDKRIDADIKWANAAKALQQQVADSGKSLIQKTLDDLAAAGKKVALDDVTKRIDENKKRAIETIDTFASGGAVTGEALKKAFDLSGDFANFAKQGVSAGDAVRGAMDNLKNGIRGVEGGVSGAASGFFNLEKGFKGASVGFIDLESAAQGASGGFANLATKGSRGFDAVKTAVEGAKVETKDWADMSAQGWTSQMLAFGSLATPVKAMGQSFQFSRDAAGDLVIVGEGLKKQIVDTADAAGDFQTSMEGVKRATRGLGDSSGQPSRATGELGGTSGSSGHPDWRTMAGLDQIEEAGQRASAAFDGLSTSIPAAMGTGLDSALALVDGFMEQLNDKFGSGMSRAADTLMQGFIAKLKQTLDSEALAS